MGEGEVVDGKVTITTDIKHPGNYTFDVEYLGNQNYTSSDDVVDTPVISHPTEIEEQVLDPIIGETEIEIELVDPDTGDKLINKSVIIKLPNGTTINAKTDENGILDLPVDLPAGLNYLTVIFEGDEDYRPSTTPFPVNVVKRNATLTPSILNNTDGVAVVAIEARDARNGSLITNGTIELTLPNGTKVYAPLNEDGIAIFTDVEVPVGITDLNATLLENPIYNQAETNISVENPTRIIKIGDWKLVFINDTPEEPINEPDNNRPDNNIPSNSQPNKVTKTTNTYKARNTNYNANNYRYNRYNRNSRYTPSYNNARRSTSPAKALSKAKYRLFITLYAEYLEGDMSYSDLVAILKLNGIEIASVSNWDANGQIILEYDDLSEVPDTIEIHDNSGHVGDYSQNINKNNAPSSDGVVDSGDIEVESSSQASSPASSSSDAASSASAAGE